MLTEILAWRPRLPKQAGLHRRPSTNTCNSPVSDTRVLLRLRPDRLEMEWFLNW